MATLYISEFDKPVAVAGTLVGTQLPQPALTDQTVAISGASAASNAFSAATQAVLLSTDAICSVRFGGQGVAAATTDLRLPANTMISFGVNPGQYVAVISNT